MFEFLFKYSPVIFSEGRISFNFLPSIIFLAFVVLAFALSLWVVYRRTTLEISTLFKGVLIGLKFCAIALLLFLLLEPIVTVSKVVPRKSSLIVLVDDSKSMSIRDVDGKRTRQEFVSGMLQSQEQAGLVEELKQNFKVQMYKFSSEVDHLQGADKLKASGASTDLAKSLNFAAEVGKQNAVSGVVLITDGVNHSDEDPLEVAALMKNRELPLFVVGVGSKETRDIELAKVSANHSVIENSVVEISALIKNKGFDKEEIELELFEGKRLVKKQSVTLRGSATRTTLKFSPQRKGFVRYSVNARAQDDEFITANNAKSFIIDNRSRKARILYIEGYPRAEFKFIRRALDGDDNLELVSLLRTGMPDKFYRQGVKDQQELSDGYPTNKRDLFEYDAIVFGSIERDFFTDEQMENTAEFVSQRGGGFLMLGGSHSFAQGGYTGSALEKLLPVELPYQNGAAQHNVSSFHDRYKLLLTSEGYGNPILQLSPDETANREKWDVLPELEGYNPLGAAKPGATILAVHPLSEPANPKIILAQQRFGRGRSMVFATSSSWLWQMGMPHEDMSHERFWRQVMRWLALAAPEPIESETDKETYIPGEQVTIKVDVRDSTYSTIKDATIKARLVKPSGETVKLPFKWSSNGTVEYIGVHHPNEEGMYLVDVSAFTADGEFLGKSEAAFYVEESKAEFSNAHLQAAFLERIADISGGKYYYQDEAKNLPSEISVMQSSYSKLVEYDLWDMPVWFLLVIFVLCAEWYVRRSRGLS